MVESYRGSYDSISLSIDEREINNKYIVAWLIDELENTNILYGYKGGEYSVNEEAHIYVSPYGYSSGQYVNRIGFDKSRNECILYTTDWYNLGFNNQFLNVVISTCVECETRWKYGI